MKELTVADLRRALASLDADTTVIVVIDDLRYSVAAVGVDEERQPLIHANTRLPKRYL